MIHNAQKLQGFTVHATDGDIGKIHDLYFDDHVWTVRYLVVETGDWLTGRRVLLSPISILQVDWRERHIVVSLTQAQVKNSPDIDTAKPVARQQVIDLSQYYGLDYYWPTGLYPAMPMVPLVREAQPATQKLEPGDPHLRSVNEVRGYFIHALDGDIGHVADFLIDEQNWVIAQLLVATSNWWFGKQVIIEPKRIVSVEWTKREVTVDVKRAQIKECPEFKLSAPQT